MPAMRKIWIPGAVALFSVLGCSKKPEKQAEAPNNVFTNYVDSRVHALNKAESVATKANDLIHQQDQQAQAAGQADQSQ